MSQDGYDNAAASQTGAAADDHIWQQRKGIRRN